MRIVPVSTPNDNRIEPPWTVRACDTITTPTSAVEVRPPRIHITRSSRVGHLVARVATELPPEATMPISFRSELTIHVPPSEVMAAMTDFDSWPDWMKGLQRVEKLTEGSYGVGTRWRETRRMFGREASEVFEVTEFEPSRRVGLFVDGAQGTTGQGAYRFVYTFQPAAENVTRLTLDGEIDMPGAAARIFGFLFKGMVRKACDRDALALKAHLEGS